jgi:hypothetical protein
LRTQGSRGRGEHSDGYLTTDDASGAAAGGVFSDRRRAPRVDPRGIPRSRYRAALEPPTRTFASHNIPCRRQVRVPDWRSEGLGGLGLRAWFHRDLVARANLTYRGTRRRLDVLYSNAPVLVQILCISNQRLGTAAQTPPKRPVECEWIETVFACEVLALHRGCPITSVVIGAVRR